MKKFLAIVLCLLCMACACSCGGKVSSGTSGGTVNSGGKQSKEEAFYNLVLDSQGKLDTIADDIYTYWYNAIYKDQYYGDINLAIAAALDDNKENVDVVTTNDETIKSKYKDLKNSKIHDEVKEVMQAYNDYYEFVINVSGSFQSFSKDKESKKKALASALKNLYMEV